MASGDRVVGRALDLGCLAQEAGPAYWITAPSQGPRSVYRDTFKEIGIPAPPPGLLRCCPHGPSAHHLPGSWVRHWVEGKPRWRAGRPAETRWSQAWPHLASLPSPPTSCCVFFNWNRQEEIIRLGSSLTILDSLCPLHQAPWREKLDHDPQIRKENWAFCPRSCGPWLPASTGLWSSQVKALKPTCRICPTPRLCSQSGHNAGREGPTIAVCLALSSFSTECSASREAHQAWADWTVGSAGREHFFFLFLITIRNNQSWALAMRQVDICHTL